MSTPDKQPLVMLNGYAATGADWDPAFLGQLAETHELICPDNRGVESIDSMAHVVIALLDEHDIDSVVVAGWSMGGFVAQAVATIAPQRVDGLVLMATDPGGPKAVRCQPGVRPQLAGQPQLAALDGWYSTPQPGGSTPVLIAHGNDDIVIPAVNADKVAQKWPAARIERFPGAGHGFMAQAPGELAAVIRSFLS